METYIREHEKSMEALQRERAEFACVMLERERRLVEEIERTRENLLAALDTVDLLTKILPRTVLLLLLLLLPPSLPPSYILFLSLLGPLPSPLPLLSPSSTSLQLTGTAEDLLLGLSPGSLTQVEEAKANLREERGERGGERRGEERSREWRSGARERGDGRKGQYSSWREEAMRGEKLNGGREGGGDFEETTEEAEAGRKEGGGEWDMEGMWT
eukprot:767642-Hanusia_phi.AAC.2